MSIRIVSSDNNLKMKFDLNNNKFYVKGGMNKYEHYRLGQDNALYFKAEDYFFHVKRFFVNRLEATCKCSISLKLVVNGRLNRSSYIENMTISIVTVDFLVETFQQLYRIGKNYLREQKLIEKTVDKQKRFFSKVKDEIEYRPPNGIKYIEGFDHFQDSTTIQKEGQRIQLVL